MNLSENKPESSGSPAPENQPGPKRPRRRSRRSSSRRRQRRRTQPGGGPTAAAPAKNGGDAVAPPPVTAAPAPEEATAPGELPIKPADQPASGDRGEAPVVPQDNQEQPFPPASTTIAASGEERQASPTKTSAPIRQPGREHGRSPTAVRDPEVLPEWFEAESSPGGIKSLKFPGLDTGRVRARLVTFIREATEHAGRSKAVLGLSGGVDSAVVASLLVEALGRERVCLFFFIEADKTGHERSRADLTARLLRCSLEVQDLRPAVKTLVSRPGNPTGRNWKDRLARVRMAALYNLAEMRQAVIVGSVNKTKRWLGAATPHGDLAYDFNPIGDLYQTQVVELARALRVPKPVMERERSVPYGQQPASGQKSAATWREVDYYLYQMLDVKISLSHLQKIGVNQEKLRWLYQQVRNSAGHRQPAPTADLQSAYVPRSGGM